MCDKGFTLVEMTLVFLIIAIFAMLIPVSTLRQFETQHSKEDLILLTQLHAMAHRTRKKVSFDSRIHFNGFGNVNQARTIPLHNGRELVITLGAGRFYVRP